MFKFIKSIAQAVVNFLFRLPETRKEALNKILAISLSFGAVVTVIVMIAIAPIAVGSLHALFVKIAFAVVSGSIVTLAMNRQGVTAVMNHDFHEPAEDGEDESA